MDVNSKDGGTSIRVLLTIQLDETTQDLNAAPITIDIAPILDIDPPPPEELELSLFTRVVLTLGTLAVGGLIVMVICGVLAFISVLIWQAISQEP